MCAPRKQLEHSGHDMFERLTSEVRLKGPEIVAHGTLLLQDKSYLTSRVPSFRQSCLLHLVLFGCIVNKYETALTLYYRVSL